MKTKKIIFVCKHNVFRSRVAEEYFKKINKNPNVEAVSRGLVMGGNSDAEQREISKKLLNVDIAKHGPISLNFGEMARADSIFVVANDIPGIIFDYQKIKIQAKVTIWKIPDEQRRNKKNITRIVLMIKRKVEELNKNLKNNDD